MTACLALSWVKEQFDTLAPKLQLDGFAPTPLQVNFTLQTDCGVSAIGSPFIPLAIGTLCLPARVVPMAICWAISMKRFRAIHHLPARRLACPKIPGGTCWSCFLGIVHNPFQLPKCLLSPRYYKSLYATKHNLHLAGLNTSHCGSQDGPKSHIVIVNTYLPLRLSHSIVEAIIIL